MQVLREKTLVKNLERVLEERHPLSAYEAFSIELCIWYFSDKYPPVKNMLHAKYGKRIKNANNVCFKAKSVENGEWVMGDLIQFPHRTYIKDNWNYGKRIEVDKATVELVEIKRGDKH